MENVAFVTDLVIASINKLKIVLLFHVLQSVCMAGNNYRLLFILFGDSFVCIIDINTGPSCIKFVRYNPRVEEAACFSRTLIHHIELHSILSHKTVVHYIIIVLPSHQYLNVNSLWLPCFRLYEENGHCTNHILNIHYHVIHYFAVSVTSFSLTSEMGMFTVNGSLKVSEVGWPVVI